MNPHPSNKFICIHGHFYQPPRENAWLETVEQQQTAAPFHDWNQRINFECYAPNASARILNEQRVIFKIRNNYNRISFNFGPTLLSWLQENDADTYKMLARADVRSQEKFGGHGNALAQAHSHLIMPLANLRDKITQVFWGLKDFEHRFGRPAEGMWLAETAVDTQTLEVLASHGVKFTILSPRQAKAVRKTRPNGQPGEVGTENWQTVNAETIDFRRPYLVNLPSGAKISLYFYQGEIANEVAFKGLLNSGKGFANRLTSFFSGNDEPQLVNIATDGESYGHHHRFGEMALAHALNFIEEEKKANLTNYGQFLELFPPTWEVQIHENSSWSCVHGVERWRNDCGCNAGKAGWHQRWRKPLRETLDWLRDALVPVFEQYGQRFLKDPWAARNEYIHLLLERTAENERKFLEKHARRPLAANEIITVWRLMEMQRHAIYMFTSCGWFFDEISGIETNQILQYALRAMGYAVDISGKDFQPEFLKRLAEAPSNVYKNGAESFQKNVLPSKVNLERVAMHFAVASLFEEDPESLNFFNYSVSKEFFEKIEAGTPRLAVGRLMTRSQLTHAERSFSFAVLYLGQQHIIGNISDKMDLVSFEKMQTRTAKAFRAANIGEVIGIFQEYFGPEKFTLSSLFHDERIKIISKITESSLELADANFRNVFNDNYQLMTALLDEGLPTPDAWKSIAGYTLNANLRRFFNNGTTGSIRQLDATSEDLRRWKIPVADRDAVRLAASERIFREIEKISIEESALHRVIWLCDLLDALKKLDLDLDIWRSQNIFYHLTRGYRKGQWVFVNENWKKAILRLGNLLNVQVEQP